MNKKLILPPEAEFTENVVPFTALPGGKNTDENWLGKFTEGTVFVSRRKPDRTGVQVILDEWIVINQGKTTLLKTTLNQDAYVRVKPDEFSKYHELIDVLEEGKE